MDWFKRKKYIILIYLILLFSSLNSSLAEDNLWDYQWRQGITNIPSLYPTPILLETPTECAFPDCRDISFEGNLPYRMLDLDNNGIPEYVFFIANLNSDNLDPPSKIEYNNLPPRIKYENKTLINNWEVCYKKENITICRWHDNEKDPDIDIDVQVFSADLRNRFDLYTIVKFNSSPTIEYFCPLVLDLDNWPQYMLLLLDKETRGKDEIGVLPSPFGIVEYEFHNEESLYLEGKVNDEWGPISTHNVYLGAIIFIGTNKSVIITIPTEGKFTPSPNYFLKTEILPNGNIRASACTINHSEELLPPKGPNAYFIFGETNHEKLTKMGLYLANIQEPFLIPPESIKAKFYEAKLGANLYLNKPELKPSIEFNTDDELFSSQNFTFSWMTQDGITNKTIQSKNGTLIFYEDILLNQYYWMHPFDKYEAKINVYPPIIQNDIDYINIEFEKPLNGKVFFENDVILLKFERTLDYKINYVIILFISIFIFFILCKHIRTINSDDFSPEKLLLISSFVIANHGYYFISFSKQHLSIGSIPYIVMLLLLGKSIYFKLKGKTLE